MNTKVEPRDEVAHETKVSPADRLVSNLDGTFYKLTEAAEIVGVSATTLRRLMRRSNTGLKAPSFQIRQGEMLVYLYSADDIDELRVYFASGRVPSKRV
jgi:hypothetical protein